MTSREQFEAWHKRNMQALVASGQTEAARSLEDLKDAMWACWSSSRLAVVVELPKIDPREWACTQDEGLAIQQGLDIAKRKIEAQGLRASVRT